MVLPKQIAAETHAIQTAAAEQKSFSFWGNIAMAGLFVPVFYVETISQEESPQTRIAVGILLTIHFFSLALDEKLLGIRPKGGPYVLYMALQVIILGLIFIQVGEATNFNLVHMLVLPLASTSLNFRQPKALVILVNASIFAVTFIPAPSAHLLERGVILLPALIFVWVFTNFALREKQGRLIMQQLGEELETANQQLRDYALQAEELAATRERNRIAREIHDSLGHYLTVIHVQLQSAQALLVKDPEKAAAMMEKARLLTKEGLSDIRGSISALRSQELGESDLAAALTKLADETETTGLHVDLEIDDVDPGSNSRCRRTIFRIVQEALTNARKHASAQRATVSLSSSGNTLTLRISDNGRGSDKPKGGFGLKGIEERVKDLGGNLVIETAPGKGFTLIAQFPKEQEATP